MTDRELFEKALEALEETSGGYSQNLIAALRERLAQPEQEPVAWLHRDSWGTLKLSQTMPPPVGAFPVYTAPQQEPVIDKSAAIRIATVLGWVPPGDTSQERVDQAQKQRQEQEPVAWKEGYAAGAAAEREACAKVCEEYETANDITAVWLNIVADAIRARSKT